MFNYCLLMTSKSLTDLLCYKKTKINEKDAMVGGPLNKQFFC